MLVEIDAIEPNSFQLNCLQESSSSSIRSGNLLKDLHDPSVCFEPSKVFDPHQSWYWFCQLFNKFRTHRINGFFQAISLNFLVTSTTYWNKAESAGEYFLSIRLSESVLMGFGFNKPRYELHFLLFSCGDSTGAELFHLGISGSEALRSGQGQTKNKNSQISVKYLAFLL